MEPVETLTVEEAAKIIGKSGYYVRRGLQQKRFFWGTAVKTSSRWSYNIIKKKLYEYAGIEEEGYLSDFGYISKLQTPSYVAYNVPKDVLKAKICRKAKCDLCDKEVDKIWFIANNEDIYCDDCLRIFETTLDAPMDLADIGRKVAHYDRLFRA